MVQPDATADIPVRDPHFNDVLKFEPQLQSLWDQAPLLRAFWDQATGPAGGRLTLVPASGD